MSPGSLLPEGAVKGTLKSFAVHPKLATAGFSSHIVADPNLNAPYAFRVWVHSSLLPQSHQQVPHDLKPQSAISQTLSKFQEGKPLHGKASPQGVDENFGSLAATAPVIPRIKSAAKTQTNNHHTKAKMKMPQSKINVPDLPRKDAKPVHKDQDLEDLFSPIFQEGSKYKQDPDFEKFLSNMMHDEDVKFPHTSSDTIVDINHSAAGILPANDAKLGHGIDTEVNSHDSRPIPPSAVSGKDITGLYELGFTNDEIANINPRIFQSIKKRMDFSLEDTNIDESKKAVRYSWIKMNL